jgi:hypothetical protein
MKPVVEFKRALAKGESARLVSHAIAELDLIAGESLRSVLGLRPVVAQRTGPRPLLERARRRVASAG